MVAIVAGGKLGLINGSGNVLGSRGQLGSASEGRLGTGVTVNAASGNLVIQNRDEVLTGVGLDSVFMRTYNSLGQFNDDNGDNWRESPQRSVVFEPDNTAQSAVLRTDWDGSIVKYTWDAGRLAFVSKEGAGAYDTITLSGSTWTWTDGSTQQTEMYDKANGGRITVTRDADSNQLTYSYDTNGRLIKVQTTNVFGGVASQNGEYTALTWDASSNNLTKMETFNPGNSSPLVTRVRYTYAGNRLSTVNIDLTPSDNTNSDSNSVTLSYAYDPISGRVSSIREYANSDTATYDYVPFVSFTYALVGSDYRVASVSEAGSDGGIRTTNFAYDTVKRITTVTDSLGKATRLAYDASGNLTSITSPADGNGNASAVTQFAYNGNGDLLSSTDGLGNISTYTYDANGNLLTSTDAAGNVTRNEYDC